LGQLFGGLGWVGSMKIDPRTHEPRRGRNFFMGRPHPI